AVEQLRQAGHARAVRQTAEGALDSLRQQLIDLERLAAQRGPPREDRVQLADERRPLLARGDGDQLDAGVPQQDANQLKGRVARTAEDGNACHDGFSMVVPDAITTSYV